MINTSSYFLCDKSERHLAPVGVNPTPYDENHTRFIDLQMYSSWLMNKSFSCMKIVVFWFTLRCNFFLNIQLTRCQHWFWQWLVVEQATRQYLKQWWPSSLINWCATWPLWFKKFLKEIIGASSCFHRHIPQNSLSADHCILLSL